jgi:hypothetical protein
MLQVGATGIEEEDYGKEDTSSISRTDKKKLVYIKQ